MGKVETRDIANVESDQVIESNNGSTADRTSVEGEARRRRTAVVAIGSGVVIAAVAYFTFAQETEGSSPEVSTANTSQPVQNSTPETTIILESLTPEETYSEALDKIYQGEYAILTRDFVEINLGGDMELALNLWAANLEQMWNAQDGDSVGLLISENSEVRDNQIEDLIAAHDHLFAYRNRRKGFFNPADPLVYRAEFRAGFSDITPTLAGVNAVINARYFSGTLPNYINLEVNPDGLPAIVTGENEIDVWEYSGTNHILGYVGGIRLSQ